MRFIAPVPSEFQVKYPELFESVELVDNYTPVDAPIQQAIVDITNLETLNWTLAQFSVAGSKEDQLTLIIGDNTKALITDDMIEKISELGLNIEL